MAHATIADVFNSFSRAASQGMDIYSRIRKDEADAELQNLAFLKTEDSQKFLLGLDDDGDIDHYMDKWNAHRMKFQHELEKTETGIKASPYYRRAAEQILRQDEIKMNGAVLSRQMDAMRQNTRVVQVDSLNRAKQNNTGNPQGYLRDAQIVFDQMTEMRTYSPLEIYNMREQVFNDAVGSDLDAAAMEGFKKTGSAEGGIQAIKDRLEEYRNPDSPYYIRYTVKDPVRSDGQTKGYDDDPQLLISKLGGAGKSAEDRAYQTWNTLVKGERERNAMSISAEYGDVLEAVSKKDPNSMALIDQGINNIRNIQNPFLSEEDRSKYNRWYDDLKKKLASDDGSAKKDLSETNANAVAENIVRRLLAGEQIIPGRNLNLQDISGIGNPLLTAVVENIGFNTESPTSKLNLETVSRTLFTALEKVINEEGNELWKSSFEQVKNIRSLNHEIAEKYNKNPGALDSWALVKYTDLISSWDFVNGKAEDIDRAVQEIGAQIISMANSERPQSVFFETDNKAAIGRAWETYEKNSILVETDAHGNEMLLPSPEGIHYGRNYGEDRRLIDTQLRLVIQKELGVATGRLTPVDEDEPLSEKGMNTRDKKAVWYYQIDGGNRFIRVNPSRDPGAWTVQTGTKGRGGEIDWGGKEKLENNRKAAAWLTPPPETGYSVTEMLEMLEKQSGPQMSEEEAAEMEKSRLYRLSAEEADRRAKEEKNRRGPLRRE